MDIKREGGEPSSSGLNGSAVDQQVNPPQERDGNSLRERYGENALKIARFSLIAHSSGKPIKKKDLMQALKPPNGELSRSLFSQYLKNAKEFLTDKLGMSIVELEPVKLRGLQKSPARDELMVISLSHKYRSMFHKVVPKSQSQDWGVMCLALILIVLKSDGIPHSDLYAAFVNANLHRETVDSSDTPVDLSLIDTRLKKLMHNLVGQRVFEIVKSNKSRASGTPATASAEGSDAVGSNGASEPEDVYFIGPYAKYLVDSRQLYRIILRMHYPREQLDSPEFERKYVVAIRSLKQKFENTCLGSVV